MVSESDADAGWKRERERCSLERQNESAGHKICGGAREGEMLLAKA